MHNNSSSYDKNKTRLNFGKYKGRLLSQVPDEYLQWLLTAQYDPLKSWVQFYVTKEIERRYDLLEQSQKKIDRIIRSKKKTRKERRKEFVKDLPETQTKEFAYTVDQNSDLGPEICPF